MDWKIENYSMGDEFVIENASFRQRITNPDGSKGKPVPLDEDYIELVSHGEVVPLALDEIIRFEKLGKGEDNFFQFELMGDKKHEGTLKQGELFEVVLAGISNDCIVDVFLTDIDLAEKIN